MQVIHEKNQDNQASFMLVNKYIILPQYSWYDILFFTTLFLVHYIVTYNEPYW